MKHKNTVRKEERIGGTPETLAKLVIDPLLRLDPEHQRAVVEIREAYAIITADVGIKTQDLTRTAPGYGHETVRSQRLQSRYNDWADEMARYRLSIMHVLDAIIDHDLPVPEICRRMGKVIDAMDLYCRLHPRPIGGIDIVDSV